MGLDQKRRVFGGRCVRPEGMGRHGCDLVGTGFAGRLGGVDRVDEVVARCGPYSAAEDDEGLGLLKVDVEGRRLEKGEGGRHD